MTDRTIRTSDRTAYLGGYSGTDTPTKGISCARVAADGRWEVTGLVTGVPNPFHLALSATGGVLYAAANVDTGSVHALRVEPTGSLIPMAEQSTEGAGTVHVAIDPSGRYLLAANHDSGNVVVHELDGVGRVGPVRSQVQHTGSGPDPQAQECPHPHEVVFDPRGGAVLVPDKGTDSIWVHPFADGELGDGEQVALPAGMGPRQLVLHPDGRHGYVVGELDSTVAVLSRDPATGRLATVSAVSTLPPDTELWNAPATARLSADAAVLCVCNRGHESVAILAVESGGAELRLVGAPRVTDAPGVPALPWDLVLEGPSTALVAHVANQHSDTVESFRVDPVAATLTPFGTPGTAPTPVCIALT